MPGLWGLLNHSRERSLRLPTPVRGLFMVSPAAHTPHYCASYCALFLIEVQCLHDGSHFANSAAVGKTQELTQELSGPKTFASTTLIQRHPQKSLIRA